MEEEKKALGRGRPKGRGRLPIDPAGIPPVEQASGSAPQPPPEVVEEPIVGSSEEVGAKSEVSKGLEDLGLESPEFATRGRSYLPNPYLRTRPIDPRFQKQGFSGTVIELASNYFRMQKKKTFQLHQYRVDFEPDYQEARIRRAIFYPFKDTLPKYMFDGTILFCHEVLPANPHRLETKDKKTGADVVINIRYTKLLEPEDPGMIQFHNIILRSIMHGLGLTLLGRHYYDDQVKIAKPNWRLELWPGYITSLRTCDNNESLLNVEVTHKIFRTDTVLSLLSSIKNEMGGAPEAEKQRRMFSAVDGRIVLTPYNNTTYKIRDINWTMNASSTFKRKGVDTTFIEYYRDKYRVKINAPGQPLLLAEPSKRDVHRGDDRPILLVPELCHITGLDEEQRANFSLMRDLSEHLHMLPGNRVEAVTTLIRRIMSTDQVRADLEGWGVRFMPEPVKISGRILPGEKLLFRNRQGATTDVATDNAEWSKAFREYQMLSTIELSNWTLIVPSRSVEGIDNLIRTLQKVSTPLQFRISQPDLVRITNPGPDGYLAAIDDTMTKKQGDVQLFYVILPNNRLELYSTIKQRISIDYGIPSQCFLAKNVGNKGLMSICTKVAIQMNAKLGGEPWGSINPLSNVMVVGFDVYHSAGGGKSIGCMTASYMKTLSRYFSTVTQCNGKKEISEKIATPLSKCIHAFKGMNNDVLPDRIMIYRDGVGEGQLEEVYNTELKQIQTMLESVYGKDKMPKLTFIVVSKRVNTRFFSLRGRNCNNPPPGTVVDSVVTFPERYDFYLVAQSVRQGTVSPTSYNVLFDGSNLPPDKIQIFTYKLCHMYYNWSGTVGVPAPCQYAHKLAYLTGLSLKRPANKKLDFNLHYL